MTLLLVSMVPMLASPVEAAPAATDPYSNYQAMDFTTKQAGLTYMPTIYDQGMSDMNAFLSTPPVGTQAYDWYLQAISRNTPTDTQAYMTLMAISGNVEVWVQNYRWFLPGDPRNADPTNFEITPEMAQFVADEFNNVIYPTDTTYFGTPMDRDGTNTLFEQIGFPSYYWDWVATDNAQRVIIKVLNIRDTNYDNSAYPYYTAGFFSSTYDDYYNRNIIQVDCWRWWQRLGAVDTEWLDGKFVDRPYVYDSTIAHEYQHLIHADWNPSDPSFMNEGCSMYAELLCGYGIEANYINSFLYTPDNSLVDWGDQGDINILADYGSSALWAIYLSDHYGGASLLRHFVQAGIPGIEGVNAALAYYGYRANFDTVFHDWRIANLIHSNSPGGGKYNYRSINLNSPINPAFTHNVAVPVAWTRGTDFGTTKTILAYDTGVSLLGAYGTDYIKLTGSKTNIIRFDGNEISLFGWTWTGDAWFSGTGVSEIDASLLSSAYVNPSDPTLTMSTKWGLETLWDFGFVRVSADGGSTWASLSNASFTTSDHDPGAYPAIVANLPGLTDYNPVWPNYQEISFDLSAYAGTTILIDFRYMTDWATTYEGWYIQSASVSGVSLSFTPAYPDASFQVTAVSALLIKGKIKFVVNDMRLNALNAGIMGSNLANRLYTVLVVSHTTPVGFTDYKFQARQVPWKGT